MEYIGVANGKDSVGCDIRRLVLKPLVIESRMGEILIVCLCVHKLQSDEIENVQMNLSINGD